MRPTPFFRWRNWKLKRLCHLSHNPVVNATQPRLSTCRKLCAQLLPDGNRHKPHRRRTLLTPQRPPSALDAHAATVLDIHSRQVAEPEKTAWGGKAQVCTQQGFPKGRNKPLGGGRRGSQFFSCEATKPSPSRTPAVHLFLHLALGVQTLMHTGEALRHWAACQYGAEIKSRVWKDGVWGGRTQWAFIQLISRKVNEASQQAGSQLPASLKGGPCPLSRLSPGGLLGNAL